MSWRWAIGGVGVSAAMGVVAIACAQGEGSEVDPGAIVDPDGGGVADGARLPTGDAGGRSDGGKTDGASSGGPGCTGKVVINELQANGASSNAEFIELFNPNDCTVELAGWELRYRSDENNPGAPLFSFVAGDSIAAGDFLVLGNSSFQGTKHKSFTGTGGLGNSGGQVGLVDDDDKIIDAVGYAPQTGGLYTEGSPAPSPGSGSIGRKNDGVDTDNNAADFKTYADHSAGAPNP